MRVAASSCTGERVTLQRKRCAARQLAHFMASVSFLLLPLVDIFRSDGQSRAALIGLELESRVAALGVLLGVSRQFVLGRQVRLRREASRQLCKEERKNKRSTSRRGDVRWRSTAATGTTREPVPALDPRSVICSSMSAHLVQAVSVHTGHLLAESLEVLSVVVLQHKRHARADTPKAGSVTQAQSCSLHRSSTAHFSFSIQLSWPVLLTHSLDGERHAHGELVVCGWLS